MSEDDVFVAGDSFDNLDFEDIEIDDKKSEKKSESDISFSDLPPITKGSTEAQNEQDEFDNLPPITSAAPKKFSLVNFSALADAAKEADEHDGNSTAPVIGGRDAQIPARLTHSSEQVAQQEKKPVDLPPLFSDIDLSDTESNKSSNGNHLSSEVASESEAGKQNQEDEIIMIGGDSGDDFFKTNSSPKKPSFVVQDEEEEQKPTSVETQEESGRKRSTLIGDVGEEENERQGVLEESHRTRPSLIGSVIQEENERKRPSLIASVIQEENERKKPSLIASVIQEENEKRKPSLIASVIQEENERKRPSLIASVVQEENERKRQLQKQPEESDASIGLDDALVTPTLHQPRNIETEVRKAVVPMAQKQDTFPTDAPSDDSVPQPVSVSKKSPQKSSSQAPKEDQHAKKDDEKKIAGATEAQLSSVSLPLYSEPVKKEKEPSNEIPTKTEIDLPPMAIETGIASSLDRAIIGFHRLFVNEFMVLMRPVPTQTQDDDEKIDTFLDALNKEVVEEMDRGQAPPSPSKNTVEKKVHTTFDEIEKDVRTLLSNHHESFEKKEEQTVQDMKFLCHQIDALNDQFHRQCAASLRILKGEIKGSSILRAQSENQQMSRVAQLREMMLSRLELEAKLNRQIHEQEDFERAAARARIGMYNNTETFDDDDEHSISPYYRALDLELQNLEETIMRDDGYHILSELNNRLNESRSALQREYTELARLCDTAKKEMEARRNRIRLRRARSTDFDDLDNRR